jgi:hypothetical protein
MQQRIDTVGAQEECRDWTIIFASNDPGSDHVTHRLSPNLAIQAEGSTKGAKRLAVD